MIRSLLHLLARPSADLLERKSRTHASRALQHEHSGEWDEAAEEYLHAVRCMRAAVEATPSHGSTTLLRRDWTDQCRGWAVHCLRVARSETGARDEGEEA